MIGKLRLKIIDVLRGTNVLAVLAELKQHQYLPKKELELISKTRRDKVFKLAKQYTTYYSKFNSFEELPVLTKDIIRNNTNALFSSAYTKKLFKKQSGGSTGTPLNYYTTVESQSYLWAAIIMSWETAGYKMGDKVGFLAGTSLIKQGFPNKVFYTLFNIENYPATPLNDEILEAHLQDMKRKKVKIIYGYAHVINELADYLKKKDPNFLPDLKGIVSTSEILTDEMRQNIAGAFKVKVVNQYGCNEGGTSAFECSEGKMHLISTKIDYEIHEDGYLISTDLPNEGFMMLKYDTGDIVDMSHEGCSCGRTFPVINRVIGRTNDLVIDKHGNRLHDSFFYFMFKLETSVKQYQVEYNDDIITVNIKTTGDKSKEELEKCLDKLKQQVDFKEYRLLMNEPFTMLRNGKHKQVIDNRKKQVEQIA